MGGVTMTSEIFDLATAQGIWATLSVTLIFYILQTQKKRDQRQEAREEKYRNIIAGLTDKLDTIHEIKQELQEIKVHVGSNKRGE